jgi:hypothetical protein
MEELKVTNFVAKGKFTHFLNYRCGICYYEVIHLVTNKSYSYPVPVEDLGNATIHSMEPTLTMMRYIRKAIEDKTIVLS